MEMKEDQLRERLASAVKIIEELMSIKYMGCRLRKPPDFAPCGNCDFCNYTTQTSSAATDELARCRLVFGVKVGVK